MSRVGVYIDGFNLYYGLKDAGLRRLYWLDLVALSEALLKPDQNLVHAHYFTARIRDRGWNTASVVRQSVYLDALSTLGRLAIHEGHFLAKPASCRSCGATWTTFEEKMSDVNLAVQLMLDACDDVFDTAIVVSGDSDLASTVRRVRGRFLTKRVVIAFPPRKNSDALKRAATGHFRVGEDKIRKSQLPDPVITPAGIPIARPPAWK